MKQVSTIREVYDRRECGEREPVISEWPGMLSFLGVYPFDDQTSADLVLKARRCQGADQKRLAKMVGVIHQRIRRWEHGMEPIPMEHLCRLKELAEVQ